MCRFQQKFHKDVLFKYGAMSKYLIKVSENYKINRKLYSLIYNRIIKQII